MRFLGGLEVFCLRFTEGEDLGSSDVQFFYDEEYKDYTDHHNVSLYFGQPEFSLVFIRGEYCSVFPPPMGRMSLPEGKLFKSKKEGKKKGRKKDEKKEKRKEGKRGEGKKRRGR